MSKLKLNAIEDDKPVRLTIELPAAVHRDLAFYGEALGQGTGRLAANGGARQHSTTALQGQPVRNQDDAHIHDIRLGGAGDE